MVYSRPHRGVLLPLAISFFVLVCQFSTLPLRAQIDTEASNRTASGAMPAMAQSNIAGRRGSIPATITPITGVNSPDRDNSPVVSADGNIMFFNSTRRGVDRPWARYNPFKKRYDDDIYYSVRSSLRRDVEEWGEPINLGKTINSSEDDGIVAISPDGQSLYFNSLKRGWENDGGPFYRASLSGRAWQNIQGLGGGITTFFKERPAGTSFRVYGGSISSDGLDFYFATTIQSPNNKHQIWVSHLREGAWSYPENLGGVVNDGTGSYAPYIAADGRSLYYSTGRPGGVGGDDIYVTTLVDGKWETPRNIGEPINNEDHNAFLSIPASGSKAYFAMMVDGNEDIYSASLSDMVRPKDVVLLAGIVSDKHLKTPIEATIEIEDLATGHTIFKSSSNSVDGRFTAVLRTGRDYGISISAPGYVFRSERYTIPSAAQYTEYELNIALGKPMKGENFALNNIIFDYNTASLSKESRPELDRIISFLQEYPTLHIEVGGHTDSIGSSDYNNNLSMLRAEAVRSYLINSGHIAPTRLEAHGYGFSFPIATNTTEEGRNRNRRSEFKVLADVRALCYE